ncbi:MAG TPA: hypothetical protein VEH49_00245 [Methylomirabilota bacterium]|jgi:hypothetical protein|nr:hypothetical protein [Methylomirabilota bacterium]
MQPLRRAERRRTLRVSLEIPLRVQARISNGETVSYPSCTQKVGGDGALLLLDAPVMPGEPLLLTNEWTSETARCFVTSVKDRREPKGIVHRYVGVGFAFPETDFWHIVFPKAGTRQATRSAQTGALIPPNTQHFRRYGT